MREVDYIGPVLVSSIFTLLLLVFYLYKTQNSKFMPILSAWFMKTRYSPAKMQKDTRKQDTFFLIILVILILCFGFKLIYFVVVVSDSMKPEFQRGDLVLTQSISLEPQIGDIISFRAQGVQNSVTHRVVDIRGNAVTTKGDNNPMIDDYGTMKDDILAKAIIVGDHPVKLKGMGSYFILDFSKEGNLFKYGDKFTFLQQMFLTIRTWGYVITMIAFSALILSMFGNKR